MKLEVLQAKVGLDGEEFAGGVHEIAQPSRRLLKAAAAAEAVGAVKASVSSEERAVMRAHIETQAESEKAYAKAQASGEWQHGNVQQFILETEARLRSGTETDTAALKAALTDAKRIQKQLQDGVSYPDASDRAVAERGGQ